MKIASKSGKISRAIKAEEKKTGKPVDWRKASTLKAKSGKCLGCGGKTKK